MKIYTKTGDGGDTSLFGGGKVSKGTLRLDAYGTVDELNSLLGVCRALGPPPGCDPFLARVQSDLFRVGAELASSEKAPGGGFRPIDPADVRAIEEEIDRIDPQLQPLKQFILPGGSHPASMLHVARSVCRRAERIVVALSRKEKVGGTIIIYLNRLSDALFMLARLSNAAGNVPEHPWNP